MEPRFSFTCRLLELAPAKPAAIGTHAGTTRRAPFGSGIVPGGNDSKFYAIWHEYTWTGFVSFEAGVAQNFNLSFTQDQSPEFLFDGTGPGSGYIAFDLPCRVEFMYMGE